MVTGIVIAVVVVLVLGAARAWLPQGLQWPAVILVVVAWGAWVFWSRGRDSS
jgi:hypothetical protein